MGLLLTGWGTALPRMLSPTWTSKPSSTPPMPGSPSAPASVNAAVGGTTVGLAAEAGAAALARAGVEADTVDLVLLATCTPEQALPATAATVQDELGTRGGSFDLNAACSGFVYGLAAAAGFLETGMQRVLLIGS